jgi:hypothetical protein
MGANLRGESLKRKKELFCELEILENLEEENIFTGDQYARKGEIQSLLMKIYEEEEAYWFCRPSENGYWREIISHLTSQDC